MCSVRESSLLHQGLFFVLFFLNGGLVIDESLQHHHQAPRPLGEWAVGVLLQEGKQLRSDLGQHGGHVVSCEGVAVVQIHHGILQVTVHETERERERHYYYINT